MGLNCVNAGGSPSPVNIQAVTAIADGRTIAGGGVSVQQTFDSVYWDSGTPKYFQGTPPVNHLLCPVRGFYRGGFRVEIDTTGIASGWMEAQLISDGFIYATLRLALLAGGFTPTTFCADEIFYGLAGSSVQLWIAQDSPTSPGLTANIRLWAHYLGDGTF